MLIARAKHAVYNFDWENQTSSEPERKGGCDGS